MKRLPGLLLLTLTFISLPLREGEGAPRTAARSAAPKSLADLQALEDQVQRVLKKVIPATVGLVGKGSGGGSGVVVSKDGLILTVAHVGQKAGRVITVTFPDGRTVKGKTLGNYRTTDAGMA